MTCCFHLRCNISSLSCSSSSVSCLSRLSSQPSLACYASFFFFFPCVFVIVGDEVVLAAFFRFCPPLVLFFDLADGVGFVTTDIDPDGCAVDALAIPFSCMLQFLARLLSSARLSPCDSGGSFRFIFSLKRRRITGIRFLDNNHLLTHLIKIKIL